MSPLIQQVSVAVQHGQHGIMLLQYLEPQLHPSSFSFNAALCFVAVLYSIVV